MKNIAILGSTGSIGVNTLDIIKKTPDKYRVTALAAKSNLSKLVEQIEIFRPDLVSVGDHDKVLKLRSMIGLRVKILSGVEGAVELAAWEKNDIVVSAMVGAAGLAPTLAAVKAGKTVALANKEALVAAGEVITREARATRSRIIPIDSEHSAIFQALRGEKKSRVRRLVLTASSGPFRKLSRKKMEEVTIEQALNHPNWSMGPKITIDSATMMNKGLEVIEARWLFGMPAEKLEVLVHPQSVIHSMVEFCDSSVIAQLGLPDMRGPISFALAYPDRLSIDLPRLDLTKTGPLTFEPPDLNKFPALAIAYEALRMGGAAPAVMNASNEVAVEAFLNRRIKFTAIPEIVEETLAVYKPAAARSLADALHADHWGRVKAKEIIKSL